MAPIVDVHAHLDDSQFNKDRAAVIERAKSVGISSIITCGATIESNRKTLQIAQEYDIVKPALGIHPTEIPNLIDSEIDAEIQFIKESAESIVAISEIGLDYYRIKDKNEHERQKTVFKKFISLAQELRIPVIVHSRHAVSDTLALLDGCKVPVVLHSFEGNSLEIIEAVKRKYFFSIPPSVCRHVQTQDSVKFIPLNHLLTESDCPYLGPRNDVRNEPSFITESVKKIAELKGITTEDAINNLYMNYGRVF